MANLATYNMADEPGLLAKTFNTEDAKVKTKVTNRNEDK